MKKQKSWFTQAFINMPMMGKLFLLMVLAGILPNAFLAVYSYRQTSNLLTQNAYSSMAMDNKQISIRLESQLDAYSQTTSLLYTDARLRNYLTADYQRDYDFVTAYQYINNIFKSLNAANSNIVSITMYIPNKNLPTDGRFIQYLDEGGEQLAWLVNDENSYGNVVYGPAYTGADGERVLKLGRMMNYNNQTFPYGYLVMEVKEASIYAEVASSWEQETYITNEYGLVIAASDHAAPGKRLDDVLPGGLGAEDFAPGAESFRQENGSIVAVTSTTNGWHVIKTVAIADVLGDVSVTTRQVLFISALCFFVTFILILAISRYFSGRVRLLNHQIRMIEETNLRHQEELPGLDELGQLSAAINRMARKLDKAVNNAYEKEIQTKKAQLTLLQSQINPHFLYNTLSGISTLALRNADDTVSEQLNHLSQFYKISLNQGREYISIAEEITLTKHYLALLEMRFPGLFHVTWDVAPCLPGYKTLKLLLQPFIENVVNHAQREDGSPIHIHVSVEELDGDVQFTVRDDGAGITPERLEAIATGDYSTGYGLWNVDARIKLEHGGQYGVTVASTVDVGTGITIKIPAIQ